MNPDNIPPDLLKALHESMMRKSDELVMRAFMGGDTGSAIPDLEEFDRRFSPDRPPEKGIKGRKGDTFIFDEVAYDELVEVYGLGAILTPEQIEANRIERKNRWLAKIRNRAWNEVPDMRREWVERNKVYGPGTDFGRF